MQSRVSLAGLRCIPLRALIGPADEHAAGHGIDFVLLLGRIRRLPKPVVAMVAGYAVGGGHILHMVCDLTVRVT